MLNFNYDTPEDKIHHKIERKLYLRAGEGGANYALEANKGYTDPRLFQDENSHILATMDTRTMLWSLSYPKGPTPKALQQRFTSFSKLYEHCKNYYSKRNIEIYKVED